MKMNKKDIPHNNKLKKNNSIQTKLIGNSVYSKKNIKTIKHSQIIKNNNEQEIEYLHLIINNNLLHWEEDVVFKTKSTNNELYTFSKLEEDLIKYKSQLNFFEDEINLLEKSINQQKKQNIEIINHIENIKPQLEQQKQKFIDIKNTYDNKYKLKYTIDGEIINQEQKLKVIQNNLNSIQSINDEKELIYNKNLNNKFDYLGKTLCFKPYIQTICILRQNEQPILHNHQISIDTSRKKIIIDNNNNSNNFQQLSEEITFTYIITVKDNIYMSTNILQKENQYITYELISLFTNVFNNINHFFCIIYYSSNTCNDKIINDFINHFQVNYDLDINMKEIDKEDEKRYLLYTFVSQSKVKMGLVNCVTDNIKKIISLKNILNSFNEFQKSKKSKKKSKEKIGIAINNEGILSELIKYGGKTAFHSYFIFDINEDTLLSNKNIINNNI